MEITVGLQEQLGYTYWPIFAYVGGVLALYLLVNIILSIVEKVKESKPKVQKKEPEWKSLSDKKKEQLRAKYLSKIETLSAKADSMEIRDVYEQLSKIVRDFVTDLTNIKVNKSTLEDIKKMGLPTLAVLIEEFYGVEFVYKSIGDAKEAIKKTKQVIKDWN